MNKLNVKEANKLLLIVFLLFVSVGFYAQAKSLKIGLFVTEWGIIFLTTFLFTKKKLGSVKEPLRLNPISPKVAAFSVLIGAAGWAVATAIEGFIVLMITQSGLKMPPQPLDSAPSNILEFLVLFFLVSLSAGFCEEFLFRGFILRGYETWGTKRAIFFSGFLFALMHASVVRFFPILVIGCVFAYLAVRLNSIFPAMIAHATNNAISIILLSLSPLFKNINPIIQGILGLFSLTIIAGGVILLPVLIIYLNKKTDPHYNPAPFELGRGVKKLLSMWTFDIAVVLMIGLSFVELLYITGKYPR